MMKAILELSFTGVGQCERSNCRGPQGLPYGPAIDASAARGRHQRCEEGALVAEVCARDQPQAPAGLDRLGAPRRDHWEVAGRSEPHHEGLRAVPEERGCLARSHSPHAGRSGPWGGCDGGQTAATVREDLCQGCRAGN